MTVLSVQKHTLSLTDASTAVSDLVFTANTPPNVQMTSAGGNIPTLSVGERFCVGAHTTHDGVYEVVTITTANEDYIVESIDGNTITAASEPAEIYRTVAATSNLTGSPTVANCIPFGMTRIVASSAEKDDAFAAFAAAVTVETGPDRVQAQTSSRQLAQRTLVTETTVVEFDSDDVNVYSGTVDRVGQDGSSQVVSSPFAAAVALDKAFLYFTYQSERAQFERKYFNIRGRITGTNELTFDSTDNMNGTIIKWYVAEAKTTAWDVEAVDIALAIGTNTNTDTITSVAMNKSFILGSHTGSDPGDGDSNEENTIDVVLTNGTTVTATRAMTTPLGAINWSGFVVTLGGSETVYRDTLAWATSEAAKTDVTITGGPVSDTADCMVHVAGCPGTTGTGSFPGTESNDVPDSYTAWTFTSTSALTVTHNTTGAEGNQNISWEVIEWDTGGAPPAARRVMVIS